MNLFSIITSKIKQALLDSKRDDRIRDFARKCSITDSECDKIINIVEKYPEEYGEDVEKAAIQLIKDFTNDVDFKHGYHESTSGIMVNNEDGE